MWGVDVLVPDVLIYFGLSWGKRKRFAVPFCKPPPPPHPPLKGPLLTLVQKVAILVVVLLGAMVFVFLMACTHSVKILLM